MPNNINEDPLHVEQYDIQNSNITILPSNCLEVSMVTNSLNSIITKSGNVVYGTPHKCPKCPKVFWDKRYVKAHIKSVHEGTTEFPCSICGKIFVRNNDLKRHIKCIHEKIKYSCDRCEKSYSDQSALRKHIDRVHGGQIYKCDSCYKVFGRVGDLAKHVKNYHERVKLECDLCTKIFTYRTQLETHMKRVHKVTKHNYKVTKNDTPNFSNSLSDSDVSNEKHDTSEFSIGMYKFIYFFMTTFY